jgi:DNA-binding transcriptional regulator YiaG
MSWYRTPQKPNRWPPLRIRDLRARLGYTQPDLAGHISTLTGRNCAANRVYRWERRGVRPEEVYQDALDRIDRDVPAPPVEVGTDARLIAGG